MRGPHATVECQCPLATLVSSNCDSTPRPRARSTRQREAAGRVHKHCELSSSQAPNSEEAWRPENRPTTN
eukprot:5086099-Alexandrium_andersonii.AAC.1